MFDLPRRGSSTAAKCGQLLQVVELGENAHDYGDSTFDLLTRITITPPAPLATRGQSRVSATLSWREGY